MYRKERQITNIHLRELSQDGYTALLTWVIVDDGCNGVDRFSVHTNVLLLMKLMVVQF